MREGTVLEDEGLEEGLKDDEGRKEGASKEDEGRVGLKVRAAALLEDEVRDGTVLAGEGVAVRGGASYKSEGEEGAL